MTAVIGLDVGGSKTRAVRAEGGRAVAETLAGSANLASVGAAEAGRALDAALRPLRTDDVRAVCAGAAGADTPEAAERLRVLLAARLPAGTRVRVVHDARLVLAAAGLSRGVAVIAGTGSVAWGRAADGTEARAGGWGYLLGDEGSGYWVGREAVRHALGRADRGEPVDALSQALVADCGLAAPGALLDHFYAHPDRRYWAGRSRLVAELAGDGDPAAEAILARAAAALAALADAVRTRLGDAGPVVLAGGFAVHQPAVAAAVAARLPGVEVRVLDADPVTGAVRLAVALAGAPDPTDPLEDL